MSLESQLHAKADEQFVHAYQKLFGDFLTGFQRLTGCDLASGYQPKPAELGALVQLQRLRYYEGDADARAVYQKARDLHRERFIADFIRHVEETNAFLGEQP